MSIIPEAVRQARWTRYLRTTDTYGTYADRVPEYRVVGDALRELGLVDDDLIVDVGAGWCDLDHYLRTRQGWRGRYYPVDGAVQGVDLNDWTPIFPADFFVAIETIEHLFHPLELVRAMGRACRKGLIVTTPNPAVVDVLAVDPTHVRPVTADELRGCGLEVAPVTFSPDRGEGDTLVAVWRRCES